MYALEDIDSSLIKDIYYDADYEELTINFRKYYVETLTYLNVSIRMFNSFITSKSHGKYYLTYIKKQFKTKDMAETKNQPKRINKSSDQKRFLKMRLDVTKINKAWLFQGEKGTYLDITLMLLPDGETDNYGNLGMVVQDVPTEAYKKDKKAKGNILGNGVELEFNGSRDDEGQPGSNAGKMGLSEDLEDDLPF